MTRAIDSLPTDLAAAHAMIIAQRQALSVAEARATTAESEAQYRAQSDHGSCADEIDARNRRALRRDPPVEPSRRPRHQPIE
jgi:hypothetical protein